MIEIRPVEGESYVHDLVEVVRCRDCQWWNSGAPRMPDLGGDCRRFRAMMTPDGYCSEAERE